MKEADCYPGKRIGRLTLISRKRVTTKHYGNRWQWLCKCDCGNTREVLTFQLGSYQHGKYISRGIMDCGNHCTENLSRIRKGKTKPVSELSDKDARSPWKRLYTKWNDMLRRCENSKTSNYNDYGGRGIKVCDSWHDYEVFKKWAVEQGYDPNNRDRTQQTLDRIDVNGNYKPSNCRLTSAKVQANNQRNNHAITISGETKNASEWAHEYGISRDTFQSRLDAGVTGEALLLPPDKTPSYHKGKVVLVNGEEMSYGEIAKMVGTSYNTIKFRYEKKGLRDDELLVPVGQLSVKEDNRKEVVTV